MVAVHDPWRSAPNPRARRVAGSTPPAAVPDAIAWLQGTAADKTSCLAAVHTPLLATREERTVAGWRGCSRREPYAKPWRLGTSPAWCAGARGTSMALPTCSNPSEAPCIMRFSWFLTTEYIRAPTRQMPKPRTWMGAIRSPKQVTPARTRGMLCSCDRTLKVTADVHCTIPNSATLIPITPTVSRATNPRTATGCREACRRPLGSKKMESPRHTGVVVHMTQETMRSFDSGTALSRARSVVPPSLPPRSLAGSRCSPWHAPAEVGGPVEGGGSWAKTACSSTQRMASRTSARIARA
mmetsp:Transcript_34661/g.107947  ORF Transcript_34661/g.107947 Transcript_34661/m.107947 type:complete len:297 (+) Transcript_34661:128-1018(+)